MIVHTRRHPFDANQNVYLHSGPRCSPLYLDMDAFAPCARAHTRTCRADGIVWQKTHTHTHEILEHSAHCVCTRHKHVGIGCLCTPRKHGLNYGPQIDIGSVCRRHMAEIKKMRAAKQRKMHSNRMHVIQYVQWLAASTGVQ